MNSTVSLPTSKPRLASALVETAVSEDTLTGHPRHEAAHAIAVIVLGGRITRITKSGIWYDGLSAHNKAVVSLAPAQYLRDGSTSHSDALRVVEFVGVNPDVKTLRGLLNEAHALVEDHAPEIEALARYLMAKGEVNGQEAEFCFLMATAAKTAVNSIM